MKQITPSFQSSSQAFKPSPPPLPQPQLIPAHPSQPLRPICRFSRRDLAICIASSSPLLQIAYPFQPSKALAEDEPQQEEPTNPSAKTPTNRAFLDISVDGEPVGRITITLNVADAPSGTARFSKLVSGKAGISYRRKEFVKIMPGYVQHGGVRSFGVDAEIAKNTGGGDLGVDDLVSEWERLSEKIQGTKNVAGSVGIVVRDPMKPPPKMKLVARSGKLEIDQEEVGSSPNGTEFVIVIRDSPELDPSTLVVGRVVEGMDVVERIAKVKTVQENSSSPYFRVAKLIGDKRAIVAERGFNRPYSKIVVTNCGLID